MARDEAGAGAVSLEVEVVYCPAPGRADRVALTLPGGATLRDALLASGVVQRHGLSIDGLRAGIWCKARELDAALRDRDRVEVYRPLTVDPKEARRLRYRRSRDGSGA